MNEEHYLHTAIVRMGRGGRLAAIAAKVGRRPDDFIGIPDTREKSWFIVKTNPQCELRAEEAIRRIGIETYAPVFRKRLYDLRSKRRIARTTPFIVGYIFVLLDSSAPDFGLVRDCDGVKDFLPLSDWCPPISFPNREIEAMREMEAQHWLDQDREFRGRHKRWLRRAGFKVKPDRSVIASGAFEGFLAAIVRMEGRNAARVVTQAFGQIEEAVVPLGDLVDAA